MAERRVRAFRRPRFCHVCILERSSDRPQEHQSCFNLKCRSLGAHRDHHGAPSIPMRSSDERDAGTRAPARASGATTAALVRSVISRAAWFLGLWLVLAGADVADLPAAALAVVAATWTSLRLLPPGRARLAPVAVAQLAGRFLYQSVVAGLDVARRALDPRLPLRPGFVTYRTGFAPGTARNVFTTLTSLLPGTVPAGDEGGNLLYHCLDIDQPVVSQLAAEEGALSRALRHD